jgi:hypothetical protein
MPLDIHTECSPLSTSAIKGHTTTSTTNQRTLDGWSPLKVDLTGQGMHALLESNS